MDPLNPVDLVALAGTLGWDRALPWTQLWPDDGGEATGLTVEPLHPSCPRLRARFPAAYELLTLVDALRVGRARERRAGGPFVVAVDISDWEPREDLRAGGPVIHREYQECVMIHERRITCITQRYHAWSRIAPPRSPEDDGAPADRQPQRLGSFRNARSIFSRSWAGIPADRPESSPRARMSARSPIPKSVP